MTTDNTHDNPHGDDRIDGSDGSGLHHDFWGDQAEWTSTPSSTDDVTTGVPVVRSSIRGWADRFLSGRVEPTRSHRVIGADPTPVHLVAEAAADDYTSGQIEVSVHDQADQNWDADGRADENWDDERWDDGWDVAPAPVARPGVDPLLARLGGLAVVLTLLVPLALGMRSDPAEPSTAATSIDTTIPQTVPPVVSVVADESATTAPSLVEDSTDAPTPTTAPVAATVTTAPVEAPASPSANTSALTEVDDDSADAPESADDVSDDTADAGVTESPSAPAEQVTVTTQPVTSPRCGADYEVAAGDFWLRLADAAKVDLADLLAVNDATVDTALYPGRTICLPDGARTPAPPTTVAPTTAAPTTAAPTTVAPTTAPPTTAAPTTAAPAPAPAPAAPADIEQIIRNVWPDDLEDRALQIAWRESNYIPTAKNFCCYGLFQMYWEVHRGWLTDMGITSAEQLYDPTTNARAAYALYQRAGGWGPWGF